MDRVRTISPGGGGGLFPGQTISPSLKGKMGGREKKTMEEEGRQKEDGNAVWADGPRAEPKESAMVGALAFSQKGDGQIRRSGRKDKVRGKE